jgi:hypothetical protein
MTFNGIKATAAAAAVLITASLAGQALAQPQGAYPQSAPQRDFHQGGDYGDRNGPSLRDRQGGDREFGDRNFNDREFDQRGRFYYGGETRQRLDKIEQWARFGVRSGRLNRWQAGRVFEMLRSIKQQARAARRDGFVSPRERMVLNHRIDATVRFMRTHMNRGPYNGGRRY